MKGLTERHVQAIWYDRALRPSRMTTRRGTAVTVVSPGEWNLGAGPDFRNAVLELGADRRRIVGDVEIHLAPSDWDFHGHGADPAYRNVIAHVTWGCGPVPRSLPPGAVSIWLGRFVASRPSFSPEAIDLEAYPFARLPLGERPCERSFGHNPDLAHEILASAGRHRLRMKARRIVGRLCEKMQGRPPVEEEGVRQQVFYEEVMTALGYARNSAQFRRVAERVPVAELPRDGAAARTALRIAGSFERWDRAGYRPLNAPERRLERAAAVFTETAALSLRNAADFSCETCRGMVNVLCGANRASAQLADARCMGKGRAGAVLANVVVPFALAEGRLARPPDWLPPEDVSEPVRLTAFRLFGQDHNPAAFYAANGLLIQGLLQIHRDYCLQMHPDCAGCRLVAGDSRQGILYNVAKPHLPV